jgi:hypothetical protein
MFAYPLLYYNATILLIFTQHLSLSPYLVIFQYLWVHQLANSYIPSRPYTSSPLLPLPTFLLPHFYHLHFSPFPRTTHNPHRVRRHRSSPTTLFTSLPNLLTHPRNLQATPLTFATYNFPFTYPFA